MAGLIVAPSGQGLTITEIARLRQLAMGEIFIVGSKTLQGCASGT
jgi:hypothetical protein